MLSYYTTHACMQNATTLQPLKNGHIQKEWYLYTVYGSTSSIQYTKLFLTYKFIQVSLPSSSNACMDLVMLFVTPN